MSHLATVIHGQMIHLVAGMMHMMHRGERHSYPQSAYRAITQRLYCIICVLYHAVLHGVPSVTKLCKQCFRKTVSIPCARTCALSVRLSYACRSLCSLARCRHDSARRIANRDPRLRPNPKRKRPWDGHAPGAAAQVRMGSTEQYSCGTYTSCRTCGKV